MSFENKAIFINIQALLIIIILKLLLSSVNYFFFFRGIFVFNKVFVYSVYILQIFVIFSFIVRINPKNRYFLDSDWT